MIINNYYLFLQNNSGVIRIYKSILMDTGQWSDPITIVWVITSFTFVLYSFSHHKNNPIAIQHFLIEHQIGMSTRCIFLFQDTSLEKYQKNHFPDICQSILFLLEKSSIFLIAFGFFKSISSCAVLKSPVIIISFPISSYSLQN